MQLFKVLYLNLIILASCIYVIGIAQSAAYEVRNNNLKKFAIVQFLVTYNFYFFDQN
jgi:hypothetical protein